MRVLEPIGRPDSQQLALAPRAGTLAGARIGLLDNLKPGARVLLDVVERLLKERFPDARFVRQKKLDTPTPCPPGAMAELAACQAVVTAIGD